MMNWQVLIATSGRELSAQDELLSLGVDAYCPVIKSFTKPRRKSKPVQLISAAFPKYLFSDPAFIDFDATSGLKLAGLTRLRLGEAFCTVTADEIARLRAEDDTRTMEPQKITFRPGDHVRITSGPLTGIEGLVKVLMGQRCELSLIDFTAKVHMPCFSLKKVGESSTLQ